MAIRARRAAAQSKVGALAHFDVARNKLTRPVFLTGAAFAATFFAAAFEAGCLFFPAVAASNTIGPASLALKRAIELIPNIAVGNMPPWACQSAVNAPKLIFIPTRQ